jgi:glycine/D-amino acid oxidase-like deaminating enzyme
MIPNNSPWIAQLNRTRPVVSLAGHLSTDVVIVGGGIAGISTAYFILKHTDKKVVLLEADKIAHGATGHNAGQITSYFERPFYEIVEEFGLKVASQGQAGIESAWDLLDQILSDASLATPVYRFEGYAGYSNLEQLLPELKSNLCRVKGGLTAERVLVSEESGIAKDIPKIYKGLFEIAPQKEILDQLETNNPAYIASMSQKKGCTNSALLCEEIVGFMSAHYRDRFSFYEGNKVNRIVLEKKGGIAEVGQHRIAASHIVLCTNGFENFHIQNNAGREIDTFFHHTVRGRIGYMAGYLEEARNPPIALSYYPKVIGPNFDPSSEPYFYLTRRPYDHERREHRLVCIGGPEKALPNDATYTRENSGSQEIQWQDEEFMQNNYRHYPKTVEYLFFWHGLMGYTPNRIRRVGHEPLNRVLMYNLGCNGVGILPSIYGGKRIAQLLSGLDLEPSIFDPQDQRKFKTVLSTFLLLFKRRLARRKAAKSGRA